MSGLVRIDFHGDTIVAQEQDDGAPLVAVKPIIERLGLDWEAQRQRMARDEVLAVSTCIIQVETPAGPRDTVALPLNLIPGFLFGIDDSRITDPETRQAVQVYKRECHDVLYRRFFGPPEREPIGEATDDLHATNTKLRLVETATRLGGKAAGRALWDALGLPPLTGEPPTVARGATQGIDFVRQFLAERTAEAPGGRVQASVLKQAYDEWSRRSGAPSMTAKAFAMCLATCGLSKTQASNIYYTGIRILHLTELVN